MNDKSVCWDYVVPVAYTCMSFANNHLLQYACIELVISSVVRDNLSVEDTQQIIGNDILDVMLQRCKLHYGMDVEIDKGDE